MQPMFKSIENKKYKTLFIAFLITKADIFALFYTQLSNVFLILWCRVASSQGTEQPEL